MATYWSKTSNGFFDTSLIKALPPDAVPVSDALHGTLMAAQATGQMIGSDEHGNPMALDRPAPVAGAATPPTAAALMARIESLAAQVAALQATSPKT